MVRSVLSVLAGIAVLTLASFGSIESSVAPDISRSPARPRGTRIEPVGQGVDVCLWLDVHSHRWVSRSSCCPAATGYPRLCDGAHSGKSDDCGNVVSGREPCITIAVDHNCCPLHTCSAGGRSCLQRPQTE